MTRGVWGARSNPTFRRIYLGSFANSEFANSEFANCGKVKHPPKIDPKMSPFSGASLRPSGLSTRSLEIFPVSEICAII